MARSAHMARLAHPASHPPALGALLRSYREMTGLSQEALAATAGYTSVYIGMLERGQRTPPPTTVELLADALGLAPTERAALAHAAQRATRPAPAAPEDAAPHAFAFDPRLPGADHPVLLVAGAPGSGKTRLLRALASRGREAGWAVVEGTGTQAGARPPAPFAPVTEAIATYLAGLSPARLRHVLADDCGWLAGVLPDLVVRVGCAAPAYQRVPRRERRLVFGAVERLLGHLAGREGTLLVLDDLQCAGDAALDLLAFLTRGEFAHPLRVIASYRSSVEWTSPALAEWLADLAAAQLASSHSLDAEPAGAICT